MKMRTNQAHLPVYNPPLPTRAEVYRNELNGVLTKQDVARIFEKSVPTVKKDIEEGRLYAEKRNEDPTNPRSGIWLIPFSAAEDLYTKEKRTS